ncbi:hypothetical protein AVEN_166837-1 [Araneus ventricosus]|uniref:Uncharacterized protein n=1 Tax=Araneus ventricosus TaxID=182803 RepID=A0A4Y2HA82_ARAVE|nr:hypothetical protein AVEN_166837-1 [Araneus ventricosus]
MMEQDYYHPVDESEKHKAIETELENMRDVEDKMHYIEYNSPNRRKIAKARNLFSSRAKLVQTSSIYEVANSEETNETIVVNYNSDNS